MKMERPRISPSVYFLVEPFAGGADGVAAACGGQLDHAGSLLAGALCTLLPGSGAGAAPGGAGKGTSAVVGPLRAGTALDVFWPAALDQHLRHDRSIDPRCK
jgi:hypothetical protein